MGYGIMYILYIDFPYNRFDLCFQGILKRQRGSLKYIHKKNQYEPEYSFFSHHKTWNYLDEFLTQVSVTEISNKLEDTFGSKFA